MAESREAIRFSTKASLTLHSPVELGHHLEILAHGRDTSHQVNGASAVDIVGACQVHVVLLEHGHGLDNVVETLAGCVGLMGATSSDNVIDATGALKRERKNELVFCYQ